MTSCRANVRCPTSSFRLGLMVIDVKLLLVAISLTLLCSAGCAIREESRAQFAFVKWEWCDPEFSVADKTILVGDFGPPEVRTAVENALVSGKPGIDFLSYHLDARIDSSRVDQRNANAQVQQLWSQKNPPVRVVSRERLGRSSANSICNSLT